MRYVPAVLAMLLAGCPSGGDSGPPPPIQMVVGLDLVRADAPTVRHVAIENPLAEDASVALVGEATGPFRPAVGALPDLAAAGAGYSLAVLVTPDGSRELAGGLTVQFAGAATGYVQDVVLSLTASVEATTVELATPAVDFGDVLIGESGTRSVRVRNPNQLTPVRVTGVSFPPAEFLLLPVSLPATLQPGQELTLTLDYTPTGLGRKDFNVSIAHSEAAVPLLAAIAAETTTWVPEIVTEFGAVTVAAGETQWLEVDVPAHAISLSLEAIGPDSATLGLLGLEGPDGTIFENAQATGAFLWSPGQGVFTATVPNSDGVDVQLVPGGGTYRFRLYLFAGFASRLSIRTVVHNRPGGLVADGRLHLNVFLAQGLNITSPSGSSRLQAILAEADRIFSQQGLRLGSISYFDTDDGTFDEVTDAEFSDLLEKSSVAPEVRLNLFFVETAIGGGVLGVAARVPGPKRNGTHVSGVMVDYDYGSATTAGYVTAHEIGHYLGLFHTVESTGGFDIIDDTLECPADGTDSVCTTLGGGYLMHWRVLSTDPILTDGQGRVMLGHPLVEPESPLQLEALLDLPAAAGLLDTPPDGWCGTPGCRAKAGQ
ncbi:MAG: choice-of-anchor D domain-containing protein [Planctomycetota bacterium]